MRETGECLLRVVFLITRSDTVGGAQIHVRDLAGALHDLGHQVHVLAGHEGLLADEVRSRGVGYARVQHLERAIRPLRDVWAVREVRRRLREIRPDLLSTHCTKAGVMGRIAGRSLGIPTLFTAHGWRFAIGSRLMRFVYTNVERVLAPLADRIITVSETDRRLALLHRVGVPGRLVTIRNAMPDVPADLRANPGAEPPRLVMVARFMPGHKDHETLLRALSGLGHLDWRLDLIGDGPLKPAMETLVRDLGLEERVAFLGFRPDVAERLARCQLFVLITHGEGLPRSILEAMRAGLPVVATDVGGVGEAVVSGKTGYTVPVREPKVLRERLARLLTDPKLRQRMGAAARARFEAEFRFDRLLHETLSLYREILDEQPPRSSDRRLASGGVIPAGPEM